MKRRFYALMLVVAMLAMTLVACGSDTNDTTNTTNDVTVNTEVEESGDDVVVEPTEEPTVTPEVEEPVVEPTPEEVVDGENDTPMYAYSTTFVFPDDMEGFTRKYLNEDYPDWSVNETHYIDTNGNEMNFEWEGPAGLGENAGVNSGHPTLVLGNSTNEYAFYAWTYGAVDETKFAADLEFTKETWVSFTAPDVPYVENGYYDIQTSDTIIEVTFEVANETYKGYNYYIVDLNRGTCYQYMYLERIEIYDDVRVMNVINSIDFWDYIPEETTIE